MYIYWHYIYHINCTDMPDPYLFCVLILHLWIECLTLWVSELTIELINNCTMSYKGIKCQLQPKWDNLSCNIYCTWIIPLITLHYNLMLSHCNYMNRMINHLCSTTSSTLIHNIIQSPRKSSPDLNFIKSNKEYGWHIQKH